MAECSIRPAETLARMRAEGTSNSKLALWPVRWHAQRAVQQENGFSLLCERRRGSVAFSTLLARKLALGRTFAGGHMRKLIWILGLFAILPGTAARAQLADPGSVGAAMGHVHFAVHDMDAAKKL